MRLSMLSSACALATLCLPLAAQDLVFPGFAQTAQQPVPAPGSAFATLPSGERVVFDGLTVDLYSAGGAFLANLGSLPGFGFPSFVAISPSATTALVGESSNQALYRVDLGGGGLTFVASVTFNADAVFVDEDLAVVSAATCGFGCGNDLVKVDVQTGTVTPLAALPGASGPLALGSNGALFYTTVSGSFPPPPGSSQILRWSAAQVASGAVLGIGDATILASGLNGAASMAVDPVLGGILVAESVWASTSRIRLFSAGGNLISTVVESDDWLSSVEVRPGGGLGHFFPYQPQDGVYLTYTSGGQIRTVRPQRPQASFAQIGSVGEVTVTGAPAGGGLLVLWQSSSIWNPIESSYLLGAFGFQLHTGVAPAALRRLPFYTPVDANGQGVFHYFDPGNLAGTLVFQTLVLDAAGNFVGSSTSVAN